MHNADVMTHETVRRAMVHGRSLILNRAAYAENTHSRPCFKNVLVVKDMLVELMNNCARIVIVLNPRHMSYQRMSTFLRTTCTTGIQSLTQKKGTHDWYVNAGHGCDWFMPNDGHLLPTGQSTWGSFEQRLILTHVLASKEQCARPGDAYTVKME